MATITLTIDDQSVDVEAGSTVLQACAQAGVEVPVFCYHPKLSIAGNCRMCLVEIEKSPKPVASCAMPAANGMVVRTTTPLVQSARKGVLEFLLINHPLDCPICDQGGECDLQDITMAYGPDHSRFTENKRAVANKNFGPLIKTIMNRCIHCTRCIRFVDEVAGTHELAAVHRGEHMEITTALDHGVKTYLSGNLVDICPVGALTSKPYSFHGRPWELTKTQSIDVMDALGSNIRIDSRDNSVMRILPVANDAINEDWITDKTRFACDGLLHQRLDQPYIRRQGGLSPATWSEVIDLVGYQLRITPPEAIGMLVGQMADAESIFALKTLADHLGCPNIDGVMEGAFLPTHHRSDYLFNSTIAGVDACDALLLVGADIAVEAPLLEARWYKATRDHGLKAAGIGTLTSPTFPLENLGSNPEVLHQLLSGSHPFAAHLKAARNPMIVVGMGALTRPDSAAIYGACRALAGDVQHFNVMHQWASSVGALDLGFTPQKGGLNAAQLYKAAKAGDIKVLYLMGRDDMALKKADLGGAFVIYQGHHGDQGAHLADVILPGCAYTEKEGTYVNLEGRPQRGYKAVWGPGEAKEDWHIVHQIAEKAGHPLGFATLAHLRAAMEVVAPSFTSLYQITTPAEAPSPYIHKGSMAFKNMAIVPSLHSFYMTDAISRHSPTMATCRSQAESRTTGGTHGL